MNGKLFLFQWDKREAEARARALGQLGWCVEVECEDGARGGKKVLADLPDAVLFDLVKRPSHSRETAHALRSFKAGRYVPLVFLDGDDEEVQKVRSKIPNAVFVSSTQLEDLLTEISRRFVTVGTFS